MTKLYGTLCIAFAHSLLASTADADIQISGKTTTNMSCSAGICTATAQKAVLNTGELQTMLGTGDVTVETGSLAKDIAIDQPLTWTSTSRLTLDAYQSVAVKKPITVAGEGALTITMNDGGKHGSFTIAPKASVQFWDLTSSLVVEGKLYTLVGDIKTLMTAVAANPSGFYALAKPYDASVDGTYTAPPIRGVFKGVFDGLGNPISNVSFDFTPAGEFTFGFFEQIGVNGTLRNIGLENVSVGGRGAIFGSLAGGNDGHVESCWATGTVRHDGQADALGGLLGGNGGSVSHSFARVDLEASDVAAVGGLVAYNAGSIAQAYSAGRVVSLAGFESAAGGLVGYNEEGDGRIIDSFSISRVHSGRWNCCGVGGLVGRNGSGATITNAYAAGHISGSESHQVVLGGFVGSDEAASGSIANGYWDLDQGIADPSQGAGNISNDPGITGLTDAQLKSGLPTGFDPKIWRQAPSRNHGLPYLEAVSVP